MSLTPGQWQAVDAIVSQHARNPTLTAAVEKACAEAWRHAEALRQSGNGEGRMTSTNKAAPQVLEPPTGPSRTASTEIAGGDGLMAHRTREPSHPNPNRSEVLPISIGDALPDVLREIARRQVGDAKPTQCDEIARRETDARAGR